jgi:hypothetical protein
VLPAVAVAASLLGRHWFAASDQALIALRVDDVGTDHTPLVGPASRLGWSHPGPLLFWWLAPFRHLLGPTGLLAGVAAANAIAVGAAVAIAHRRGGARLAALVAIAAVVLTNALGLGALLDPWNPTAAFFPFLLLIVAIWAVVDGDVAMLPVAVAAGTWSVQCHFGYLPVVGGLLVLAVASVLATHRGDRRRPARRWLAVAAAAGLVLWLPPLVQQLTADEGNLGELLRFAIDPGEEPVGWSRAAGVLGVQLHPAGAWLTGDDALESGLVRTGAVLPALAVVALVAAVTAWSWRRGRPAVARLGAVALAGTGLALVATARVTGLFVPYVLRWWWAVAAMAAVAVAEALLGAATTGRRHRAATPALVVVVVGLVAGTGVVLAGLPAPLPFAEVSRALGEVATPVAASLDGDRRYLVRGVDSATFGAAVHGLFLELERRGAEVRSDRLPGAELAYGEWRLASPGEVDGIVVVLSSADLAAGVDPPPGAREVARSRPTGDGVGYVVLLAPP